MKRSFRNFEKMARVVVVTRDTVDMVEKTTIYGPYETKGIAQAMLTRYGAGWYGYRQELVEGWIEECEPVVWHRVDTGPGL